MIRLSGAAWNFRRPQINSVSLSSSVFVLILTALLISMRMGAPAQPTAAQYAQLEEAGHLQSLETAHPIAVRDGSLTVTFALPRQGVSLVKVTW